MTHSLLEPLQRASKHPAARKSMGTLRILLPLTASGICLWLLSSFVGFDTLRQLPATLTEVPLLNVGLAAAFCMLSFWAIGRYDAVAHRHFQTGMPLRQARRTGKLAVALSQTLGFGLFTGAIVRWRMLPALSLTDAMRLSAFVCISFLVAMGFVTAIACLILPAPEWTKWPAFIALLCLACLSVLASFLPVLTHLRRKKIIPSLTAFGAIGLWTSLDLLAAATVLYVLLPVSDLSFTVFVPVFLMAYGTALLSSAPGGVGPFELTLLALLPQVPAADLLAGVLAYRLIYYALPAILAATTLLRPLACSPIQAKAPLARPPADLPAEGRVIVQNGGEYAALRNTNVALWHTHQCLTVLSSSKPLIAESTFDDLKDRAKNSNRVALLYKCSARTARAAQAYGWQILRIADEAVLHPQTYTTDSPLRSGLRRKLRKACRAGVTITQGTALPLQDMAQIDHVWQSRNGRARGGTMGRFCPDYVQEQTVFLAHRAGELIGFASFHATADDWCLDLIRTSDAAPDGTVHMLVQTALDAAKTSGAARFSLAAIPACSDNLPVLLRGPAHWMMQRGGAAGLRQFKSAFAPDWHPRFAAAPNAAALALGLCDITLEVHHPAPLPRTATNDPYRLHKDDEDYEVDLSLAS